MAMAISPTDHSKLGAAPSKPATKPMASRLLRWVCSRVRRSSALACAAKASKAITRPVSQPQIRGGSTSTSGGTIHIGTDTTMAAKANREDPSAHPALAKKEAPWRRASEGKRRSATRLTNAGVISSDTSSSVATTIKGVSTTISNKGASMLLVPPRPTASSQAQTVLMTTDDSKKAPSAPIASCQ